MRLDIPGDRTLLVLLALVAGPAVGQQGDARTAPDGRPTGVVVIDSHQIDRFEAIGRLQEELRRSPDDRIGWVMLGELAQEVALEVPASQAASYLAIARGAFERAIRLSPEDAGLREALRLVEDQEAGLDAFRGDRSDRIGSYLSTRRRELSRPGARPVLRDFASPDPRERRGKAVRPGPPSAPDLAPFAFPGVEDADPVTYDTFYRSVPRPRPPSDPAAVGSMPTTAPPTGSPTIPPPPTAPKAR